MLLHEGCYAAGHPILLDRHRHQRRTVICAIELVLLGISDSFCSQIDGYAILIVRAVEGIVFNGVIENIKFSLFAFSTQLVGGKVPGMLLRVWIVAELILIIISFTIIKFVLK